MARSNVNKFLKAFGFILALTVDAVFSALHARGYTGDTPALKIPQDIRTVHATNSTDLEPEIIRTPCCPKCYKTYSLTNMPKTCNWRKSEYGKFCGETLWKQRQTRKGKMVLVPRAIYATQSFPTWLRYFLGRLEIEEYLGQCYQKNMQNLNKPVPAEMHDIQDSPAWRGLGNFLLDRYNLVWSIYIDWFNPYTNKIAGKYFQTIFEPISCLQREECFLWCYCSVLSQSPTRGAVSA